MLRSKRLGPYPVKRAVSSVAYELELPIRCYIHTVAYVSSLISFTSSDFFWALPSRVASTCAIAWR